METKKKYFRRRGKRGVLYLAERHCGVLLNDCLETTDERMAEVLRRDIHISVERGEYRAGKISFEQAVKESFGVLVAGKAASTRGNYESAFRIHLVPWFGKAKLTQIDTVELLKYKRVREDHGAGEGIMKAELWLVRWVLKQYGRKVEPCREPYRKPHKPVDRFPEEGDVRAIVAEISNPMYQSISLIAAYSGMRGVDVLKLMWSDVDFKSGFIRIRQQKTGRWVRVRINPPLNQVLKMIPRGLGDAMVFPNGNKYTCNYHWQRAKKKIGLEWVRFHDNRHFFCSNHVSNGVDLGIVRELAGHKSIKTTERYAKYSNQALKNTDKTFVAKSLPNSDGSLETVEFK